MKRYGQYGSTNQYSECVQQLQSRTDIGKVEFYIEMKNCERRLRQDGKINFSHYFSY
jgi:hypothetical protein